MSLIMAENISKDFPVAASLQNNFPVRPFYIRYMII